MGLKEVGEASFQNRHRRIRGLRIHGGKYFLAGLVSLTNQSTQQRAFVVGVQRGERSRQLLGAILVGAFQFFPETAKKPSDCAILGKRIERPNKLCVTLAHHDSELVLNRLEDAIAFGRTELLE